MTHFISATIIMGKETFFFLNQVGKRESNKNRTYNSNKTSPSRNHKPCSKALGTFSTEVLQQTHAFLARIWISSKPWIAAALRVPGLPRNKARSCHGFHLTTYSVLCTDLLPLCSALIKCMLNRGTYMLKTLCAYMLW